MIAQHDAGTWPIVFTHGNLSSLKMLVRRDKVVTIVDWQTAGWSPSYWEYTTAHNVNIRILFWEEEVHQFLKPLPDDVAMEQNRNTHFGDFR